MPLHLYLRQIVRGEDEMKPLHIDLQNDTITLGANEYKELKRYSKVSDQHAYIVSQEQRWYVKDLNSSYGTFVNGRMIGKELYPLQIGDQIRLGATEGGFLCALSVKPLLTKIKEEPFELIDISDDPTLIKTEPKDDYKISNIAQPENEYFISKTEPWVPFCKKLESIETEPYDVNHSLFSNSTSAKSLDRKDLLKNFIKTENRLVKIKTELIESEDIQASKNLVTFPAPVNNKKSSDTTNSLSLNPECSFSGINYKRTSASESLKPLAHRYKQFNVVKDISSSKSYMCVDLFNESQQKKYLNNTNNNKYVNSISDEYKIINNKRSHLNSVQGYSRDSCEENPSNRGNIKISLNATATNLLSNSFVEDWYKASKRLRLCLESEKDDIKKSDNIKPKTYDSAVYSSDIATLLKANSCDSPSIKKNSELNTMDIDNSIGFFFRKNSKDKL